jgi:membrane protein implicated in regulation of membrane protease activity
MAALVKSPLGQMVYLPRLPSINLVALASQIVVFPLVGIHVPVSTNLEIGFYFTVISVVRSYVLRRWFNARLHDASQKLAGRIA